MPPSTVPLTSILAWAETQPQVRAALLTSTRAVPGAYLDEFSDYDIILVVQDVRPFHASRDWLEAFGQVLALYRDPLIDEDGLLTTGFVIQFVGGLKLDFTLWPLEKLQAVSTADTLPDELDAGYRILLDKDGLTTGIRPPTYQSYIPKPPTAREYCDSVEDFYLQAIYVGKYLRRGDFVAARYMLDGMMKQEHLIPMLVWHFESETNWSIKPGLYGRRINHHLRPDLYAALQSTYAGAGLEESWQALYNSIGLMRAAAQEVAQRLDFTFPEEIHSQAVVYIEKIKQTEKI